jgi:hypothetical protein
MGSRRKHLTALIVTFIIFVLYSAFYVLFHPGYGLRSVWPIFFFTYAFTLYLVSKPLREDKHAD